MILVELGDFFLAQTVSSGFREIIRVMISGKYNDSLVKFSCLIHSCEMIFHGFMKLVIAGKIM